VAVMAVVAVVAAVVAVVVARGTSFAGRIGGW
jgi:hypothetical protein